MSLKSCKLINISSVSDIRGTSFFFDKMDNPKFVLKRIYYIYNKSSEAIVRANYAYKTLKQIVIPICGQCKVSLDDGINKEEYLLSDNNKGLYIAEMIWRTFYDFTNDSVILVLSNNEYIASDCMKDYSHFLSTINK